MSGPIIPPLVHIEMHNSPLDKNAAEERIKKLGNANAEMEIGKINVSQNIIAFDVQFKGAPLPGIDLAVKLSDFFETTSITINNIDINKLDHG
jgi:hypothetical protein